MRRSREQSIGEVIKDLLKKHDISSKFNEAHIVTLWDTLMGPSVAKYTVTIEVEKNVLFVQLNNAALKQELTYKRDEIKKMLNKEVGQEVLLDIRIY